jgi:hypothetical protein
MHPARQCRTSIGAAGTQPLLRWLAPRSSLLVRTSGKPKPGVRRVLSAAKRAPSPNSPNNPPAQQCDYRKAAKRDDINAGLVSALSTHGLPLRVAGARLRLSPPSLGAALAGDAGSIRRNRFQFQCVACRNRGHFKLPTWQFERRNAAWSQIIAVRCTPLQLRANTRPTVSVRRVSALCVIWYRHKLRTVSKIPLSRDFR